MQIVKTLRYFYVDAVCWVLCLVSSFISLALAETDAGRFLLIPLMIVNIISIIILSLIYCCEKNVNDSDYDLINNEIEIIDCINLCDSNFQYLLRLSVNSACFCFAHDNKKQLAQCANQILPIGHIIDLDALGNRTDVFCYYFLELPCSESARFCILIVSKI